MIRRSLAGSPRKKAATTNAEKQLRGEVESMIDNLDQGGAASAGGGGGVLPRIFNYLPKDVAHGVLIQAAETEVKPLDKLRKYMTAFNRFPKLVSSHGGDVVRMVAEWVRGAAESATKVEVHDLLTVLSCELLHLTLGDHNTVLPPDLLEETPALMVRWVFASMKTSGGVPESGWDSIMKNLELLGRRSGWDPNLTSEMCRQKSLTEAHCDQLWQKMISSAHGPDNESACFYLSTFMFLRHLVEYWKASQKSCFLVEAFSEHLHQETSQVPPKRRRTTDEERSLPIITHFSGNPNSRQTVPGDHQHPLVVNFLNVVRYYEFLQRQFPQAWANLERSAKVTVPLLFRADFASYHGQYRESLLLLGNMLSSEVKRYAAESQQQHLEEGMVHIKMASVLFCLNDHPAVAEHIITYTSYFDKAMPDASEEHLEERRSLSQATVASRHRTRHLHFLSSTRQSVLSYACKLLVRILKGLEPGTSVQDNNGVADMAMGHLLVLLQYGFNRCDVSSSDLLGHILRCIKMREVFNYPIFCHYVISVDFLEEFALLANSANPVEAASGGGGGGVNLILDATGSA